MTCHDAEPLLARYADDEQSLAGEARESLRAHLAGCVACRTVLDEQRDTAALLRSRPAIEPRPGLVARVAARIEPEDRPSTAARDDVFGAVNWRAWAFGVVPVAAALIVAAYVDIGTGSSAGTQTAAPATIVEYLSAQAPAALQSSSSGDALIEAVLTDSESAAGEGNVR